MSRTATKPSVVYEEIIDMAYDYLGPASRRFITKIAKSHLNKRPSELTRDDVAELHKWAVRAFALVAENSKMIDEFSTRFLALKSK